MNETLNNKKIINLVSAFLIIVSLYFVAKFVNEVKASKFIGGGVAPSTTISFDGTGEVDAPPNIANISFTVQADAKTVAEAQTTTTATITKALAMLKTDGVADKDIQTQGYNSYPKYDSNSPCYAGMGLPCQVNSNPQIIGYTVSQNVSVKVRNIDDTGKIMQGLGDLNVTNISGPDFTIDNPDAVKNEARTKAIADAKSKAEELAKELGVTLVRIVNFSESNGGYPMPMYAKGAVAGADIASAPAPVIPAGQNTITSNVTITYEIR